MTLNVQRLTPAEAFEKLRPEWEALDARLFPRTPFTSPIWNQLWWKHFARDGLLRRDEFLVLALRDDSGGLVAVAPLMRTEVPSFGPFRIRKVQFFGTDPSLTEIRGIVCPVEQQGKVVDALIGYFANTKKDWESFNWSGIRLDGEAHRHFMSSDDIKTIRTLTDYIISLPGHWEEFRSRLSNNTRKSLRKGYEFVDRDGHKIALRVIRRPEELGDALERFFKLHRARAGATGMKPHRDSFAQRKHRNFLRDIAQSLGVRDQFRVFELEIGGEIVASRVAIAFESQLYLYFSGYDLKWRQYSVMTTLMAEIIKWAIECGFTLINLSTGTDLSKLRWKPTEIGFQDFVQSSRSLRGRIALGSELLLREKD
jgi:CelD/BcsL family acetyltransferase involved in cellulose biosynthesis